MKIAVLISGNGTNLKSILEFAKQTATYEVIAVISNKSKAKGLGIAQKYKIATHEILSKGKTRKEFEEELITTLKQYKFDLIVLSGFMRVFTNLFIDSFSDIIINIHPSLLPKYPGLNTHKRAIAAKDKFAGATTHFVNNNLDMGMPIMQVKVNINNDDNAKTLCLKVLEREHILYPLTLYLLAKTGYCKNKSINYQVISTITKSTINKIPIILTHKMEKHLKKQIGIK